jgi:hypothetical protein
MLLDSRESRKRNCKFPGPRTLKPCNLNSPKPFFWFVHEIVRVKRREDGTPVLSEPLTIDVGDTDDTDGQA